ncbi:MAG: glycosyltransferase [Parafilimonas terrae]|nr:glycosyltransferase [Parafilimonas terrae]
MNKYNQTICLSMIVKNEAHVIRRCLDTVRPLIDHWVIVDTGSTDGTQDAIRAAMSDLPGTLVERPWVDFATNRTEALRLARPTADYTLIIDADDELIIPEKFELPRLDQAGYLFKIIDQNTEFTRIQLVSNQLDWRYRGAVHEFLECPGDPETPLLPLSMRYGGDGARHRDPDTEERDIAVMERVLASETDPFLISRYMFYLARSYRDIGEQHKAIEFFLRRADLGFGEDEVYLSLLEAALLMEKMGAPEETLLKLFDGAISICPHRAEARHAASQFCRRRGKFEAGYRYGEAGIDLPLPEQGISINTWIYAYGMREEFAVNAFHVGQHGVCIYNCSKILDRSDVPRDVHARIGDLARQSLTRMVDPAWGCQSLTYTAAYSPLFRS